MRPTAAAADPTPAPPADPVRPRLRQAYTLCWATAAVAAWGVLALRPAPWNTPTVLLVLWLVALVSAAVFLSRAPSATGVSRDPPATRPGGRRRVQRRRDVLWAAGIIALFTLPRTVALTAAPYKVTLDEADFAVSGLELFTHHPWEIVSAVRLGFLTRFSEALQAWPCLFLEPLLGARVAPVVLGIGSQLLTYALARQLFGSRAALAAVTLLACSYWHIVYSRTAYPYMQPMLFVPGAILLLVRGVVQRRLVEQFLGGVLLGVCMLAYTPARVALPIFVLWFVFHALTNPVRPARVAAAVITITAGFVLFLTPYLQANGTQGLFDRYVGVATSEATPLRRLHTHGWSSAEGLDTLREQLQAAAGVYYRSGSWLAVHVPSPAPFLDLLTLTLALGGLGLSLLRWRDSRHVLLLVWAGCTFLGGQVLTDVPYAAYRAAPLLPALAIAAGWMAATAGSAVGRRLRLSRRWTDAALALGLVVLCLPPNLRAVVESMRQQAGDEWTATARFIGQMTTDPIAYIVAPAGGAEHIMFRLLAGGRDMRDLPSLSDSLGTEIDATRDAVFVLPPTSADAAVAIRRCYPGAEWRHDPTGQRERGVLGLYVSGAQVESGRGCTAPAQGPGLRARYFAEQSDGSRLVTERIEDWPVRFHQDLQRFQRVEWTGFLHIPAAGTYDFQLHGAYVDGDAHIGHALRLGPNEMRGVFFEPGLHPVLIRCRYTQANGFCWLRWQPPGGAVVAVPPALLVPP